MHSCWLCRCQARSSSFEDVPSWPGVSVSHPDNWLFASQKAASSLPPVSQHPSTASGSGSGCQGPTRLPHLFHGSSASKVTLGQQCVQELVPGCSQERQWQQQMSSIFLLWLQGQDQTVDAILQTRICIWAEEDSIVIYPVQG